MTPAEGLVLVVATALAATVVARGRKGTLDPTAGALLLILAMLATAAALAHIVVW